MNKAVSTKVSKIIHATPAEIYEAYMNPEKLALWRVPGNMRAKVHEFDPKVGGTYKMTLTYLDPDMPPIGKTSENSDTFKGKFIDLIENQRIVELIMFESLDPNFSGEMLMITTLLETENGTEVTVHCEDIPKGISLEDNEAGTIQALEKLANLLERGSEEPRLRIY